VARYRESRGLLIRATGWSRPAVGAALGLLLAGCTIIRIEGAERVEARFGVLAIEPRTDASVIAYRLRGAGLVPGHSGPTLGYRSEDVVLVYREGACHLILFEPPDDGAARRKWRDFIEANPSICMPRGEE